MKLISNIILMFVFVNMAFCQNLSIEDYTFHIDTLNNNNRPISDADLSASLQGNIVII